MGDRVDHMLSKEAEMHEELNDLQRINSEIEEENSSLRLKSEENFDQV